MSVLPSVLIPAERIRRRLDELAEEISRDYAERDLVVVGLLRASFIFLADLVRRLDLPLRLDFLTAASGVSDLFDYGDGTSPQSPVAVGGELAVDVRGRDCLVVDAVLDTGRTLAAARRDLYRSRPPQPGRCPPRRSGIPVLRIRRT